jgi:hypothetical protein
VWVVLFVVAVTRLAATATEALPRGWDPAFHMILAEKIRLTHHAIGDWLPFDPAGLNYPTGIHVLIVVMSWLSGLALPMVFKYLIPLAGVLTTGEIYVLARRMTNDAEVGLFAAIAYGLWAIDGSIGYSVWGGLPNEMAMLFFTAMLSIWVEKEGRRILAMGIFFAAVCGGDSGASSCDGCFGGGAGGVPGVGAGSRVGGGMEDAGSCFDSCCGAGWIFHCAICGAGGFASFDKYS